MHPRIGFGSDPISFIMNVIQHRSQLKSTKNNIFLSMREAVGYRPDETEFRTAMEQHLTGITARERLDTAIAITEPAAKTAMRHFRRAPDVEIKQDLSPVTIADKETEKVIRAGLAEHFPGESVFGEEFGRDGDTGTTWIIDPIDGTRSFIGGVPLFGMLLGYLVAGRPVLRGHQNAGAGRGVCRRRRPARHLQRRTGAGKRLPVASRGEPVHQ